MFKQFDRDGNGYITLMEASNILQRDPFKFPPSKVLTLLKQFDKDGNGKLDIEEFAGFYAEAKAMSVTHRISLSFNMPKRKTCSNATLPIKSNGRNNKAETLQ